METLFRTDVIAEEGVQMQSSKHYEGVFTLGSGYLHIRGSFEEGLKACLLYTSLWCRAVLMYTGKKRTSQMP